MRLYLVGCCCSGSRPTHGQAVKQPTQIITNVGRRRRRNWHIVERQQIIVRVVVAVQRIQSIVRDVFVVRFAVPLALASPTTSSPTTSATSATPTTPTINYMHTLANQLQAWRGKDYDEDAAGGFSGASQMEVDEDDDEDTNKATSSEPQHNNTSSSSSTSPQNGKQIPSYGIGDDVRRLSKHDFLKMEIIGQFNLGFILVKLKDDLYILDQHACDEKYNYEELYKNTVVHVQPLIRPTSFEATASEELTIIDYLDIFKKNGFHLTVDHDAAPGRKLKITALPFSKKTTFGINDVHELADLLSACDSSRRNTIRPPKIDAMFASRSCRMSIMVGRALERSEQIKIVTNLATMDQPWNCPHGRPTLQHLVALNKTNVKPVFATK